MKILEHDLQTIIPPEVVADAQAVADSLESGQPLEPDVARRIRERAKKITQSVYEKHGVLDVAVPAIRELRGELTE